MARSWPGGRQTHLPAASSELWAGRPAAQVVQQMPQEQVALAAERPAGHPAAKESGAPVNHACLLSPCWSGAPPMAAASLDEAPLDVTRLHEAVARDFVPPVLWSTAAAERPPAARRHAAGHGLRSGRSGCPSAGRPGSTVHRQGSAAGSRGCCGTLGSRGGRSRSPRHWPQSPGPPNRPPPPSSLSIQQVKGLPCGQDGQGRKQQVLSGAIQQSLPYKRAGQAGATAASWDTKPPAVGTSLDRSGGEPATDQCPYQPPTPVVRDERGGVGAAPGQVPVGQ